MANRPVRSVCVPCRRVDATAPQTCHTCSTPMVQVSSRWRAPKRRDDRAWARISAGELNWDRRAARTELNNGVPDALVHHNAKGRVRLMWLSEVNARRARRGHREIKLWRARTP